MNEFCVSRLYSEVVKAFFCDANNIPKDEPYVGFSVYPLGTDGTAERLVPFNERSETIIWLVLTLYPIEGSLDTFATDVRDEERFPFPCLFCGSEYPPGCQYCAGGNSHETQ